MQIIYKRSATGAPLQWAQQLEGNRYRTIAGVVGGKLVQSEWTQCLGKNVGRANATTPEQQAAAEVESNYKKKLAQGGYHDRIADIDRPNYFKPMLAKKYDDYVPTADDYARGLVWGQGKADGLRCISSVDGLWSRQGKPILSVPHIAEILRPAFEADPDCILDGEIYADKFSNDFNAIISLARKTKPTVEDLAASAASLEYHVYDMPSVEGGFGERFARLEEFVHRWCKDSPIRLLPTHRIHSQEDLDRHYAEVLEAGWEGQIVRIDGIPYENKRTSALLKRKQFKDAEYEIVEIVEGIGNRSGMAGQITYRLSDGRTFGSGIRGGVEFYRDLLRNARQYIGGQGTVRYFNLTPDGIPRFPVTVAVYEGRRDI